MTLTIVGLTGPSGSGKSTLAQALAVTYGFEVCEFAGELKRNLTNLLELSYEELEERKRHTNGHVRRLMQEYGAYMRAYCGEDHWIDRLAESLPESGAVVIPDVRYPNEVNFIRWRGGVVVGIRRPGAGLRGPARHHESERYVGGLTRNIVVNDGSPPEFLQAAKTKLQELGVL